MFDIGIQELVLVFVVALIVFGPRRLPELGRTLGKFMVEIRKGLNEAKSQMESGFKELEKQSVEQVEQDDKGTSQQGGTGTGEGTGKEGKDA